MSLAFVLVEGKAWAQWWQDLRTSGQLQALQRQQTFTRGPLGTVSIR